MSSSERIIVGGVEGGATHSKLMLFEAASMKALATVEGPSTNVFILGLEETCKRIWRSLKQAGKILAGSSEEVRKRPG